MTCSARQHSIQGYVFMTCSARQQSSERVKYSYRIHNFTSYSSSSTPATMRSSFVWYSSLTPVLLVIAVIKACTPPRFISFPGYRFTGPVLEKIINYPISIEACERMCLLKFSCLGFNMVWSEPGQTGLGICKLTGNSFGELVISSAAETFWGKCPFGMSFEKDTNKCYKVSKDEMNWDEANAYCKQLHPKAHIIEIRSQEEQQLAAKLIGDFTFWLGARRRDVRERYDIIWVASNTSVPHPSLDSGMTRDSYSNWYQTDPDHNGDDVNAGADCIRAISSNNHKWYDTFCTRQARFICQFWFL